MNGVIGDPVTLTVQRKGRDFVPQRTLENAQEQKGMIVFKYKRKSARTRNAMVSEK